MSICNIRLATTEAGLPNGFAVYSLGLPEPSLPLYADHSSKAVLASGGQALRGFQSTSILFSRLTFAQARTLRKLVEDSLSSTDGLMYLTIDKGWNGSGLLGSWIDVKGVPHMPDLAPVGNTQAMIYDNVTLFVNNLTTVNDPASGI